MPQLPEQVVEHLFMVAKALSQAAFKGLQCKGTTIFVANGVAAGQKAPHFMIHIIPRNDDDGISMSIPENSFPKKDMTAIGAILKKVLDKKKRVVEAEVVKEKAAKPKKVKSKKVAKKKKSKSKASKKDNFDLDAVTKMLGE